jgi:hypothetical protein
MPDYYYGDIAEILVYKNALTDSQIVQVQQYLSAKYGINPIKTFNETFNDFFNNRARGVCVVGRWRVKPGSVRKCLKPCKTNVKIPL